MANIPIWPGSATWDASLTPFSFYDNDLEFQADAVNIADWCAKRLGYPLVDIELQSANFFTAFEEATNEYGKQLYDFQIINNFQTLEGNSTGSNFNNQLITPNLGGTINISDQYGNETIGGGGDYKKESGSLVVLAGQSKYDLLIDPNSTLNAATTAGSESVYMKRIYHYQPAAINRYFDPYAGTGTGIQSLMQTFGFGNYSPGVNFMLMPLYFDVLKLQAIEFNDQIRKSGYHFELENGRYLKIWPIPTSNYKLWYDYKNSYDPLTGNSLSQDTDNDGNSKPTDLITDLSNAPYKAPVYSFINEPGKQWIRKYTLALAKEMLGSVRGKYQTVPIPGAETTLDHSRLLSEAVAEKADLVEKLRTDLEATSKEKVLERETKEKDNKRAGAANDPMFIYIG